MTVFSTVMCARPEPATTTKVCRGAAAETPEPRRRRFSLHVNTSSRGKPAPAVERGAEMFDFVELEGAGPVLASLPHPVVHLKGFTHGLLWPGVSEPPAPFGADELRKLTAK